VVLAAPEATARHAAADPHTLVLFATYNIVRYIGDPANCCIVGYHSAFSPVGAAVGAQTATALADPDLHVRLVD
jgi:hypothetical protein